MDFYRDWNDYKMGFGSVTGNFWLGLDILDYLTSQAGHTYELRIDMVFSTTGEKHFLKYSSFRVGSEADNYRLNVSGFSSDRLQDTLAYQNGMPFSTHDRDIRSCVSSFRSGWWYNGCHKIHLNGMYGRDENDPAGVTIGYNGIHTALSFVEMKFRRTP